MTKEEERARKKEIKKHISRAHKKFYYYYKGSTTEIKEFHRKCYLDYAIRTEQSKTAVVSSVSYKYEYLICFGSNWRPSDSATLRNIHTEKRLDKAYAHIHSAALCSPYTLGNDWVVSVEEKLLSIGCKTFYISTLENLYAYFDDNSYILMDNKRIYKSMLQFIIEKYHFHVDAYNLEIDISIA